jgi:hypothetical protein
LPLANPSHCRADSGLSPYRTCAHRAHAQKAAPDLLSQIRGGCVWFDEITCGC